MEDMIFKYADYGILSVIVFFLLTKGVNALTQLTNSVNKLTETVDKLSGIGERLNRIEMLLERKLE